MLKLYRIECLQGAALSSWGDPRTEEEVIDQFMDYAQDEWETPPESLTIGDIENLWDVRIKPYKEQYNVNTRHTAPE